MKRAKSLKCSTAKGKPTDPGIKGSTETKKPTDATDNFFEKPKQCEAQTMSSSPRRSDQQEKKPPITPKCTANQHRTKAGHSPEKGGAPNPEKGNQITQDTSPAERKPKTEISPKTTKSNLNKCLQKEQAKHQNSARKQIMKEAAPYKSIHTARHQIIHNHEKSAKGQRRKTSALPEKPF